VANSGATTVTINSISLSGANSADFSQTNNCGTVVAAGKSCVIQIAFIPAGPGTRAATLTISDNATGSPQSVALAGTATQATAAIAPSSLTFASQLAGTASNTQTVTVTNTGQGNLQISKISFSGNDPGDFSETDNCGGASGSIPSKGTCAIQVTFKPATQATGCGASSGGRCAMMTIAGNSSAGSQIVSLSGSEMDFEFGNPPAGSGTTATVTAGAAANFSLEIDALNGFPVSAAATVALACTGSIPEGTCTVPSSVTLAPGSASAPFTVMVSTTASSLVPGRPGDGRRWPSRRELDIPAPLLLAVLAMMSIAALGFGKSARRASHRFARAMALFIGLAIGSVACGGGGGGGNAPPPVTNAGTPAGTYSLTITGSAEGTSRTIPLKLIVEPHS
jgi:hypothetical protein